MLPDWSNLPEHLLVQVLGFVEQAERLRNCALVTAAWAAAARRATRHASCSLLPYGGQDSLRDFLRHGDSGVRSVKLLGVHPSTTHPANYPLLPVTVPLTRLTHLEAQGTKFPVPGSIQLLSGLRQLDLKDCNSHIGSLAVALQGSCSSLTSLLLGERWDEKTPFQLRNLLLPLTALVELELPCWRGEELPDLPVGLTRLLLRRSDIHTQPNTHSADVSTYLQPLTSLQVLQLHSVSLQHHLPLTALREVELGFVRLDLSVLSRACSLQQLQLLHCESISGPQFSVGALQGLAELRLLKLRGPSASGAITQLTSLSWLSALTQLDIQCAMSEQQWDVLAQDVVSRASGLQKLVLGDATQVGAVGAACLELDQLRQLVSSCSQLQHLSLYADVTSPAAAAGLKHLPRTCMGLELFGDQWCLSVLAQLTWLTDLTWEGDYNLSDVDLRQLTALRNLQVLSLGWCWGISDEVGRAVDGLGTVSSGNLSEGVSNDGSRVLYLKFKTGPQGSVCEQLQAVCKASPQCALADLPGLLERNEQLSFAPLQQVVVDEAAAVAGGVDHMRQQFVVMAQAVEGLLWHGMYAALLEGLSGSQPTAEQFAEACAAVREQNAHRLLRVFKVIMDRGA